MKMRTGFVELILLKSQEIFILFKNAFQSIIQKLYYQLTFLKIVFLTTQFWLVFLSKNVMPGAPKSIIITEQLVIPLAEISFDFSEMPACHSGRYAWLRTSNALCVNLKRGGSSSGNVPPAATHPLPAAWEAIGLDASEWLVPHSKIKLRFILMMELETKQFISEKFHEFCNSVGIQLAMLAEKESWAHGLIEFAMKDIKQISSAIQISQPSLEPAVPLLLACSALNSTEYTRATLHSNGAMARTTP